MAYNGSGTFLINTAGQPVVPNTVISATAFNALTNDLANGLSTCITKDGQTTPTANIPMGNNKITGLAPGTSGTDAANLSQVQGSTAKLLQSVTGTDTITAAMVPALTSYSAGQMFYFVAAGDNTGAVTINIDSLGAKSVTRDGSTALVAGDIVSGEVALIVYDGTRFQLLNGNSFTNLNVSNNLTLSGGTANGVLYLNGSKVATSGAALTFDGTRLGIGTASPGSKLTVSDTSTGALIRVSSDTNGSNRGFEWYNNSTSSIFGSIVSNYTQGILTYDSGGSVYAGFHAWNLGTSGEQMRLTTTGLGIGTTSPANKLDISGSDRIVRLNSTANNALIRYSTTGTARFSAGLNDPTGWIIYDDAAAAYRMVVDYSGNVGIGTASPGARLDVVGGTGIRVNEDGASTKVIQVRSNFAGVGPAINVSSNDPLLFQTNNTERGRFTAGGNFLVGTTSDSGSASNSTNLTAGIFNTVNGATATVASGVAITLFTSVNDATYIVTARLTGSSPTLYTAVAIIKAGGGTLTKTDLSTASSMTISVSGTSVQATQSSGASQNITYYAIRVA